MGRSNPALRGRQGELWAARALRVVGYRILERRWRIPGGEIDLIAEDDQGFAFIEVKTRQRHTRAWPESAVTRPKLALLHNAAEQWLIQRVGDTPVSWRVDVVAIEMEPDLKPWRITIFRYFEL